MQARSGHEPCRFVVGIVPKREGTRARAVVIARNKSGRGLDVLIDDAPRLPPVHVAPAHPNA